MSILMLNSYLQSLADAKMTIQVHLRRKLHNNFNIDRQSIFTDKGPWSMTNIKSWS